MSTPSFYAIIPATVRYCKELEPNAKLLYGEITALAQREGFCWASNAYFAQLYEVDISTIKRWISSLKENGFIEIEVDRDGFQVKRKIWISLEIKNNITRAQNCADVGSKISGGQLKNEPHSNTGIITQEEPVCIDPSVEGQISKEKEAEEKKESKKKIVEKWSKLPSSASKQHPDGHWQEIRLQDIFEASVRQRKDWSTDEIHDAWKILVEQNDQIRDPLRYVEGIILKLRNFKKSEYLSKNKGSEWKTKKNFSESESFSQNSSESDTEELVSLGSLLDQMELKKSQNGSRKEKIS